MLTWYHSRSVFPRCGHEKQRADTDTDGSAKNNLWDPHVSAVRSDASGLIQLGLGPDDDDAV